jgi:hypothetical protein
MHNSKDRRKYLKLMWELEKRLEILNSFSKKEIHTLYLQATIESEALQLRKILELIAYASLVAHKDAYIKVRKSINLDWHAKRIIKTIEELNPGFYPIPTRGVQNGNWKTVRSGFMTKKEFATLYDRCGGILHAKNPFSRSSQRELMFHERMPIYVKRIENLIQEHRVRLAGIGDEIHVLVPLYKNSPMRVRFLKRITNST